VPVVPPDPVADPKIPLDHLDDLPLPGRPADPQRIDDDEITLPGHAISFLPLALRRGISFFAAYFARSLTRSPSRGSGGRFLES